MSRLAPIDPQDGCPEARDIIRTLGHPPGESSNFIQLLARSPAALEAYLASSCALGDGRLTSRQRVMIALAVSEINGSPYGTAMHHAAAIVAGLNSEDITNARYARANDAADHAMLRFAAAVVLQRGDIREGDLQALRRAGFDDGHVAEIVANIALCAFADFFNNVACTAVDYPSPAGDPAAAGAVSIHFPPAVPTAGAVKQSRLS